MHQSKKITEVAETSFHVRLQRDVDKILCNFIHCFPEEHQTFDIAVDFNVDHVLTNIDEPVRYPLRTVTGTHAVIRKTQSYQSHPKTIPQPTPTYMHRHSVKKNPVMHAIKKIQTLFYFLFKQLEY